MKTVLSYVLLASYYEIINERPYIASTSLVSVLFKLVILIYKIVYYILNFLSDKLNHNKIYNNFKIDQPVSKVNSNNLNMNIVNNNNLNTSQNTDNFGCQVDWLKSCSVTQKPLDCS
jgi:hypothetical protein